MPLPGVHESVTFVDHVKTNKGIFEIFSPSGSQAILVFPYQMGWRCSNGKLETPLTGASNARGLWETDDFRPISCSIWGTVIVRWAHSARQSVSGTVSSDCLCSVVYLRYDTSHGFMSVSGPRAPGILPTIMSWTGVSMHYTFAMPV